MLSGPVEPTRPRQNFKKTDDGRGTIPTFDNKLNISITLYWIKNTGEERQIAVMPPGDHRPPQSWSVYPRSGCWMAKDGAKELLRVSSTTVCQYGFQVGGQLESKNENWVPHGQPGAEEPPDPPPTANTSTATTTHNSYNTYSNKKSPTGFCGLSNQGATCYLNSLLQSLYMTPELRAALWQWEWDPSRNAAKEECIPYQLQRLFVNLYKSKDRAVSTEELTKSFGWTGSEAFAQHDVQEMFNLMSQALETTFTGTPQAQLMKSLYEGRTKDGVRCKDCGTLSARPDVYTDICLSIRQFGKPEAIKSVEEGLQNYFEQEQMDGENQYQCDKCGKKCDAEKGLACMTVPYILSLQIKRFDYDWELDRRVKLDDKVTFPMVLDMAPYLSEDVDEPPPVDAPEVPAPEPEAAAAGGADSVAAAAAAVPVAEFEPAFGRDGALIKPVDRSDAATTEDGASTLPYELFAVLVHRGTAAFGHYYAYIKDFETGKWLEFNDGTVVALQEKDVEKAFGGKVAATTSYTGYGAGGAAASQSTASAYMVMYRRKDDAANINVLTDKMVPANVVEEMQTQEKQKKEKDAEAAAIKAQLALSVYFDSRVACLSLPRSTAWGEVKEKVLEQMGGYEGLGLPAESSKDCWRLRTIKFLHDDCADEILEDEDSTELVKVTHIKTYSSTDLLIETKQPGEDWPRHYGEFGPAGYQHHRVFKIAMYTPPPADGADAADGGADDADEEGAAAAAKGKMSPWATVMFGYKATLGDLREAVSDIFGTQPGAKICKLGVQNSLVNELVGDDSLCMSDLRHPQTVINGERLYVADAPHASAVESAEFKAAATEAGDRATVHFTEVDSDQYTRHLQGSKKMTLIELKAAISAELSVEPDRISLHDPDGRLVSHPSQARRVKLRVKTATAASAGQAKRTHNLPVYLYKGDKDDLSTLLLEMDVDTQLTVPAFKAALRAKLAEAAGADSDADAAATPPVETGDAGRSGGRDYGPEDGTHLRIRKLDYSSTVWMDSQTVAQAMGNIYSGRPKLAVTVLSGPEVKTTKEDIVISVARWRPSELEIEQPHTELVVKSRMECSELRELLLPLLSSSEQAASAAATEEVQGEEAAPVVDDAAAAPTIEDIGLLLKKYNMNSKLDVWKSTVWDADRAPPREYTSYQGQKIVTPPDSHIGNCTDGTLWYYRLNTEVEKEMTDEETKAYEKQAKRAERSKKGAAGRREESGVKITVAATAAATAAAAAGQPEQPPLVGVPLPDSAGSASQG